jgi:hypothetical protein
MNIRDFSFPQEVEIKVNISPLDSAIKVNIFPLDSAGTN